MTAESLIALLTVAMAFCVSLAVTGFARLGGLGDVPDHRSSHSRVTPTGGGLGIVAGIGGGLTLAGMMFADYIILQPGSGVKLAALLSLTFAMAFLGLLDDRFVLSAKVKFGIILLLSVMAAHIMGPVTMLPFGRDHIYLLWWSGLAGTILWVFTVTNAVNFMDGINGIFGSVMGLASGALCLLAIKVGAPVTALVSGVLAASLFGFLPYNLRGRAAVFSGDCGALTAAFVYAWAVLFLVYEQPEMRLLYAGPLLIMPFLADVLMTLIRKPFKGIGLSAAHNSHLYQRWARYYGHHLPVTFIYVLVTAFMAFLVHQALARGTLGSFSGLMLMSGCFACLYAVRSAFLPD